jgi:SseB protein N-terminal domain
VPELTGGDQRFRDDRGAVDAAVEAALAAFADGSDSEQAVLTALAGSRLLVPVIPVPAGEPPVDEASSDVVATGAAGGGAAGTEMAMPTIVGRDGRRALPAFTSLQALSRWQPTGRPVAVPASAVWQSAVQESCAVVIDIAGPVPVAVEGARLTALAQGLPVPELHEDPDVWQLAAAVAAEQAPGVRVRLSAPQVGLDLTVELAPPAGVAGHVPDRVAASVGEALSARLADRAPRGIAVMARSAAPPGSRPDR